MRDLSNLNKYMSKTDNGFYSPMKAISYNRPVSIITGHRSGGKSTGIGRLVLLNAIKNHRNFIYIRRTLDELNLTKTHFFDSAIDIINKSDLGFKIVYFDCTGNEYRMTVNYDNVNYETDRYNKAGDIIDESEEERQARLEKETKERAVKVGGAIALSQSQKVKSGFDFTDVDSIIYDEFIAEHQTGYLGSAENPDVEYQNLISIYVSCDRGIGKFFRNETRLFLIGNMANIYNPILLKWNVNKYLRMSTDAKFIAPKGLPWTLQIVSPSEQYKKEVKQSFAFALMDESERDYNVGNVARSGEYSKDFIKSVLPRNINYKSGVVLGGVQYGIYEDCNGYIYINKYRPGKYTEALDMVSYANGNSNVLVTSWRQSPILNVVYIAFLRKKLYFNNLTTQHEFMQYLEFIPR